MNKIVARQNTSVPSRSPFRGMLSRGLFEDLFDQYLSGFDNDYSQIVNVSMDVAETDQSFEVKVDLPGFAPDDVDIQIDSNTLTIRGERSESSEDKDEEKQFHRIERCRGSFSRSVVLPNSINEEATAAEFKDGVLKIVIPKSDEAKTSEGQHRKIIFHLHFFCPSWRRSCNGEVPAN